MIEKNLLSSRFSTRKYEKNLLTTKDERMNIGDKAPERLGVNENGIIEQVFLPKQIKTSTHAEQLLG